VGAVRKMMNGAFRRPGCCARAAEITYELVIFEITPDRPSENIATRYDERFLVRRHGSLKSGSGENFDSRAEFNVGQ
jgi:hypothetical protein